MREVSHSNGSTSSRWLERSFREFELFMSLNQLSQRPLVAPTPPPCDIVASNGPSLQDNNNNGNNNLLRAERASEHHANGRAK